MQKGKNKKVPRVMGLFFLMLISFLLLGAACEKKKSTTGAVPAKEEAKKEAVREVFQPLKLVYSLKNFGPSKELTETLWLEGKTECGGREAYSGVIKLESTDVSFQPMWAKATIYADNGEMAVSRFGGEDGLAFDDSISVYNDLEVPLTLSSIFAYAGKNFNAEEVWSSASPIILKGVNSGMSLSDYSFVRQEEDATGVLPCQKFKVITKETNSQNTFNACVAREVGGVKLPFVVSFAFAVGGTGDVPSWKLTGFSSEKSGVAFAPQCLEKVKCVYVSGPTDAEQKECRSKSGQMDQEREKNGCPKKPVCLSLSDIAERDISRTQNPNCPINQSVKNKLLQCRKNNQPNFNVTKRDEFGCSMEVSCQP